MRLLCRLGIHDWKYDPPENMEHGFLGEELEKRTIVTAQERRCKSCGKAIIKRVGTS